MPHHPNMFPQLPHQKGTTMAKKPGMRPIRLDQFKEQLEDIGLGNLQEVQLSKTESVYIRLRAGLDQDDAEEFLERINAATTSKEAALTALDYYPPSTDPEQYEVGERAEAQWEKYEAAGGTADTMAAIWASASADQAEQMGKLRPKRS